MGHREYMFSSTRVFEIDDDQTRFHQQPERPIPMENATVSRGNFTSRWNSTPRSSDYHFSNISPEMPNYVAATLGSSYDPYLQMSAAESLRPIPPYHFQHASSSNYCRDATYGDGPATVNPSSDSGRGPCKRKSSAISPFYGTNITSGNFSAGSSSSFPISSGPIQQEQPSSGSQHWSPDPIGIASNYRVNNSLLIAGEGSHRNVRSRSTPHLEASPAGVHLSGNVPQHFYATGHHHMMGHSGTGNLAGQNAGAITWSRSHIPMSPATGGRFLASDDGVLSHEAHQFVAGSNVSNDSMEMGRFHDHTQSRNPGVSLQALPPAPQTMRSSQSSYVHRPQPSYGDMSGYSGLGYEATSYMDRSLRSGLESYAPSRQSRPLPTSIGRRNSYRNGRARISYHRMQSLPEEEDTRDRFASEDFMMMMDHSAFYGSTNLLDQHRDMRLDIENMSYEELLALEERIGNVNTGLSEDMISKCLKESMYPSEEGTMCIICLEEYNKTEKVAAMDCGHNYHRGCIEKWLLMKNACPVCKAQADTCCRGME
ncbi:uncharacterized protein LOC143851403 isoform X2 [Tasmannia lanceolata]